jgi:membrane-bound lytic murein transglycosylase D
MTIRHLSPLFLVLVAALVLSGCNSNLPIKGDAGNDAAEPTATVAQNSGTDEPDTTPDSKAKTQEPSKESKQVENRDLWHRVRNGFKMEQPKQKRITQHIKWLSKHPSYMKRLQKRSRPYIHFILEQAEKRGVPTELALLPAVESAFRPFAYSHGRAAGLWQFIPSTGRHFNLKQNWWYDGRRDVVASTHAAFDYLEALAKRFNGDWNLALAAYNSGAGTVSRAIRKNKRQGKPTDYWSLQLPKETRNYVPRLLALTQVIRHPEKYGITLKPMPDRPYFASVDIGSQLDLALAAEMAGISTDNLYRLNPGFNRWATAPDGPHRLNLPIKKCETFSQKLAKLDPGKRIRWKRYKVRSGDSLSTIADKHGTTTELLRQANKLSNNGIRTGKHLVIPMSTKSLNHYALSADKRKQRIQNRKRKGTRIVHVVKPGDTFWDLAKTYKVGHEKLARWNGMAPRDTLSLGQKLVLWVDKKKIKVAGTAQLPSIMDVKPPSTTNSVHYKVRDGDSLARIAERFKVRVADLKRWNTIEGKYLKTGQSLKLFVDVTAQTL